MSGPHDYVLVDTILLALEKGIKTEAEAVEACAELAKSNVLDWTHLRSRNEALYHKVWEWCKKHPPEL